MYYVTTSRPISSFTSTCISDPLSLPIPKRELVSFTLLQTTTLSKHVRCLLSSMYNEAPISRYGNALQHRPGEPARPKCVRQFVNGMSVPFLAMPSLLRISSALDVLHTPLFIHEENQPPNSQCPGWYNASLLKSESLIPFSKKSSLTKLMGFRIHASKLPNRQHSPSNERPLPTRIVCNRTGSLLSEKQRQQ